MKSNIISGKRTVFAEKVVSLCSSWIAGNPEINLFDACF